VLDFEKSTENSWKKVLVTFSLEDSRSHAVHKVDIFFSFKIYDLWVSKDAEFNVDSTFIRYLTEWS
jgi:hypothetical protein